MADSFDAQISALKATAAQQRATASQFQAQAKDYQSRVNQLNAQINELQAQINLGQAQAQKLTTDIVTNEANLANRKQVLGANLKSMYLNSSVTPLEMVASSNNLSDYFNQQQYQDSIKNKIQSAMAEIIATQKLLAVQKTQIDAILRQQEDQQQLLASARAEANQLLATASQNAASANAQVAASNSKIASIAAAQAASLVSSGARFTGNGTGSYPWATACQDSSGAYYGNTSYCAGDDGMGYILRQCVSWVAWRRGDLGLSIPRNWGNGGDWYGHVNWSIRAPQRGDMIAWNYSYSLEKGHVAFVEGVSGSDVTYSQYNFNYSGRSDGWGKWSQVTVNVNQLYRPGVSGFIR